MRKVIGGKLYDCDTATEVASATNGLRENDHKHWDESSTAPRMATGLFMAKAVG
jgi:hypothetical protein